MSISPNDTLLQSDDKRAWRSWALYDWANSAFATTVMAGFFPLFFKAYWANPNNPSESTYILEREIDMDTHNRTYSQ